MPDIEPFSPRGMFHEGWSAEVEDYAIVCGWALEGKLSIVGDVVGGLYGFEGDTGCLLYTSPSPRDRTRSRMPSSA